VDGKPEWRGIGMGSESQNPLSALKDIRDCAFLLNLGRAYLCEEPFMKKIGLTIDSRLKNLREEILSLKKQFPGKFVREVSTDELLEQLHKTAQGLQNPDQEINERCTVGELGRELEETVHALAEAVNAIRFQVEGTVPAYTKADSVKGLFGRIMPTGKVVSLLLKVVAVLAVVAVLSFSFLFFTMEKESPLLEEIAKSEAHVRSQQGIISELTHEKAQISQRIASLKGDDLSRQVKIDIMELNVGIRRLDEKIQEVEVDISGHEDRIRTNREKVEKIRRRPFMERLLRR
jgi:hypothetical protein